MTKEKFILKLSLRLKDLASDDIERACEFYSEMISDRMEDGMSEEEAVEALGSLDYIEAEIREALRGDKDFSDNRVVNNSANNETINEAKGSSSKRELKPFEIVLLILGFPLWFPLLISLAMVVLALYIAIWAVVGSSYIANLALGIGGLSALSAGFGFLFTANFSPAGLSIAEALMLIGGAIILFIALKYITKLGIKLTKSLTEVLRGALLGGRRNA